MDDDNDDDDKYEEEEEEESAVELDIREVEFGEERLEMPYPIEAMTIPPGMLYHYKIITKKFLMI